MKVAIVEPGEGIVLRNFIDQEKAILTGKFVRQAIEKHDIATGNTNKLLTQRWIANAGVWSKLPLTPMAKDLIDDTANEVGSMLGVNFRNHLFHIAATHMNSSTSHYHWHIDPNRELRVLVNISEGEEKILTSRRQLDRGPNENALSATEEPAIDDVLEHVLEPGYAYFINNLAGYNGRLFHATHAGREGRTMLRFEQHVSNPLVNSAEVWLRDSVEVVPIPRSA